MRTVGKTKPGPQCLISYPRGSSWEDVKPPCPEEVRKQLVADQQGLCCYCMARIRVDRMKVEHFHPQSAFPEQSTDWGNLLGACLGGQDEPEAFRRCDTRKGSEQIGVDPRDAALLARISYSATGKLQSNDNAVLRELESVLGLNQKRLVDNRKAALVRYVQLLRRRLGTGTWSVHALLSELANLRGQSELPEYAGYIEHWLEVAIRKHGAS
ncbi:MAG: TIGR02646 family protein [Polyangiaceae bacterium]|nr:TIGR02646 family protein [Polyangiaceae bacterium]MCB9607843.1 TIGR02646 family protein [Polyangiaceae bacterium]